MKSNITLGITTCYRTSGKSDHRAQAYANSIPLLLEKAMESGISAVYMQRTLFNTLQMPDVCLCMSGPILKKILAIISKHEDCLLYLEMLLLAVSKYHKIHDALRQQVCNALERISLNEDERRKIITFVRNRGTNTICSLKTPFDVKFFNQLEDIELAELLGGFMEYLQVLNDILIFQ